MINKYITGLLKAVNGVWELAVAGTDYQSPLVAGTDYLTLTGDGSGLTGIVTSDTIVNKDAAYTLVPADLTGRKTFTNSGGDASVVPFTFPTAVVGYKVSFEVVDSGGISIDPNGIEIFKVNNVSQGAGQAITYKTQGLRIDVVCVVAGELIVKASGVKRGCLVYASGNQTLTAGDVRKVAWNSEESGADPEGMHDTVTNNSRITIPAGVAQIRILGNLAMDGASNALEAGVYKNNANFEGMPSMSITVSGATRNYNFVSSIINVVAGDYLEAVCGPQTTNVIIYATYTGLYVYYKSWFAVEIIE